jgi:AraC-like DNA-binding protein
LPRRGLDPAGAGHPRGVPREHGELRLPGSGAAVDHTCISDPPLRAALSRLHDCLLLDRESLAAEARLALIGERIAGHLTSAPCPVPRPEPGLAGQLRELLDEHLTAQVSLARAAAALDRSVPHLVRSFTRRYGLSPYAYLVGRRIDAARRLLLQGAQPAEVAAAVGFYDQAHFTRHFKRHTSATPASYARSHARQ